jgi:hypothetical protein
MRVEDVDYMDLLNQKLAKHEHLKKENIISIFTASVNFYIIFYETVINNNEENNNDDYNNQNQIP